MKKWIVLCIIVALAFAGCAAPAPVPTTDAPPETANSGSQYIGCPLADLQDLLLVDELTAYGYAFALDPMGNPVVLQWDINGEAQAVVTGATVLPAENVDNSPKAIMELEMGITIYEVVAAIGLPNSIPATGAFYMEFLDSTGTPYWLAWQKADTENVIVLAWIVNPETAAYFCEKA